MTDDRTPQQRRALARARLGITDLCREVSTAANTAQMICQHLTDAGRLSEAMAFEMVGASLDATLAACHRWSRIATRTRKEEPDAAPTPPGQS